MSSSNTDQTTIEQKEEVFLHSSIIWNKEIGIDRELSRFVDHSAGTETGRDFFWTNTRDKRDIQALPNNTKGFGNLQRINDIQRINKYLEKANREMDSGQYLVVRLETKDTRKERILNASPKIVAYLRYGFDFIMHRVLPKWAPTKKMYFGFTKGKNRVISLWEAMGRLICCGFEVKEYRKIGFDTYIIAQKTALPVYDLNPTYGPLVSLNRVGQGGRLMKVYKFRTMYPYSEYLQEYVFEKHGTKDGYKFEGDFRITRWGKFFRKYWLDELPMLWHFLKGELKVVGVRPLSEQKFYTLPKVIQEKRIKTKPGLIPPYFADIPETEQEYYDSIEGYLDSYMEKPLPTDTRYFFKSVYNILFKGARSR